MAMDLTPSQPAYLLGVSLVADAERGQPASALLQPVGCLLVAAHRRPGCLARGLPFPRSGCELQARRAGRRAGRQAWPQVLSGHGACGMHGAQQLRWGPGMAAHERTVTARLSARGDALQVTRCLGRETRAGLHALDIRAGGRLALTSAAAGPAQLSGCGFCPWTGLSLRGAPAHAHRTRPASAHTRTYNPPPEGTGWLFGITCICLQPVIAICIKSHVMVALVGTLWPPPRPTSACRSSTCLRSSPLPAAATYSVRSRSSSTRTPCPCRCTCCCCSMPAASPAALAPEPTPLPAVGRSSRTIS